MDNNDTIEVLEHDISGLYYIDYLNEDNMHKIISQLDECQWLPLSSNSNSRLVQHYGYKYDYKTYNINVKTFDIPPFLNYLKNILHDICIQLNIIDNDYDFNQCIVNNYLSGQGISKHVDVKKYGSVIGCFTLGSGATMTFKNKDKTHDLYVKPNSLYIMSGDSRYIWSHEMVPKKYDTINNNKIYRDRRVSVTFRNVPL